MGHYDDQREAYDERVAQERAENIVRHQQSLADEQGITLEQFLANELHRQNMNDGQAIYEEEVRRNELMVYYLKHQPSTAAVAWPNNPGGTKK